MKIGECPTCGRGPKKLYQCRHCKALVCFGCVFVKKCCGVSSRGLTARDLADGSAWLVIGVRPDGSRLVLDQAQEREQADRVCARFRAHLEGYAEIRVEHAGDFGPGAVAGLSAEGGAA